jgi:GNAT superfamily N-acetyltransferase
VLLRKGLELLFTPANGRIIARIFPEMNSPRIRNRPVVTGEPIIFRAGNDFPDPTALIPSAVPWFLQAGQPYFDWLCGSRDLSERMVATWMTQPSSEVFVQRIDFLQCGSALAGGVIGIGGAELKKARTADINAYWATLDVNSRGALIEKLSQSVSVFAPVAEDEYYISKAVLDRSYQAKGLAKMLVAHFLDQGNALGYSKFRADIHTENWPSLRCARSMGFEIFYTGESSDGALRYHGLRMERKTK